MRDEENSQNKLNSIKRRKKDLKTYLGERTLNLILGKQAILTVLRYLNRLELSEC